jgi:hypothetical protein
MKWQNIGPVEVVFDGGVVATLDMIQELTRIAGERRLRPPEEEDDEDDDDNGTFLD